MDLKNRVDAVVDDALGTRIVGTVIMAARDGDIIYRRAAGFADREAGRAMEEDAIFRLASVTKPMVATTALAMIERHLLGLNNAVSDHLPYFRPRLPDGSEGHITIRHLLTHTAGLGYDYAADPEITTGMQDTDLDYEANFARLALQPLLFAPGSGWCYSVATDVLGAVIARIHGSSLAEAVEHYVTGPLDMSDTGFSVTDTSRLAVPYVDGDPQPVRMQDPHTVIAPDGKRTTFSPGRVFNPRAFQSGGAGMVGTAGDFLTFLEALRNRGGTVLHPDTLVQATTNQIDDLERDAKDAGQRFGYLGAVIVDPAAADRPQAPGTYRWGGIYGHDWFVDPANGISAVIMTNTALEGCNGRFPKDVARALYGAA
ncbi:MAG TPA: serine hydrolase domain-containing protein [Devosiaceae bacterium]|nr:serine hydrolase domain-containing protein [Devosiaceae bacterium]